jgi:very-short-patch-repair endonuclease
VGTIAHMGELVRLSRGLWRPAEQLDDLAGRCAALLTVCPDGAVVADFAAAQLHGTWLPELDDAMPIETILRRDAEEPRAHAGSRRGELTGRRRKLRQDEICIVAGVPATTPARTWIDLAEHLSMPDLIAAGDSVLRSGTSLSDLTVMVRRARGRRGVVRARVALPLLNVRSRSRPESHLRYALVSSGLPEPRVNLPIHSALGEWLAEPDLSYEEARLALEYNGADHAKVKQMQRDITRELDVHRRGGWRVEVFGPKEVFVRPDQTAAFVREIYRERVSAATYTSRVAR